MGGTQSRLAFPTSGLGRKLSIGMHLFMVPLPWSLRRRLLMLVFNYEIDRNAHIGWSIVAPRRLKMSAGATIGHLNFIRGMDRIVMERGAGICDLNWVYGIPTNAPYFPAQPDRRSEFIIEEGGGIVRRHYVDCTDTVHIGRYAMVAGHSTYILTHAVDMRTNQQSSKPVKIGHYSMVGARSVILGGAELPAYSALGAGSTLRSAFTATHGVYSGVPARRVGDIPPDAKYFTHDTPGVPGHRIIDKR